MSAPRSLFVAAALVISSGSAACMTSPTDDHVVRSRTDTLAFRGFHIYPNVPVHVEAWNRNAMRWDRLATTRSATTSTPSNYDEPLYLWSRDLTLADTYWTPGLEGHRARVRAKTVDAGGGEYDVLTVEPDWVSCYQDTDDPAEFATECASDHSSEAWIRTADYCNTVPRFDLEYQLEATCANTFTVATSSPTTYSRVTLTVEAHHATGPAISARVDCALEPRSRRQVGRCTIDNRVLGIDSQRQLIDMWNANRLVIMFDAYNVGLCGDRTGSIVPDLIPINAPRCSSPAPTPPPPPPPGPDLVIEIGAHDGLIAPFTVCNRGTAAVTTDDFVLRYKGAVQTGHSFVNMMPYLPTTLSAGACVRLPDATVGIQGTTAGRSEWVEAFIDWENDVTESVESNNQTTRARTLP